MASVWLRPDRALTVAEPPRTHTGFLFHETCPPTLGEVSTQLRGYPILGMRGAPVQQTLEDYPYRPRELAMKPRQQSLALAGGTGVVLGALIIASATTVVGSHLGDPTTSVDTITPAAQPLDPEVILPSRVDAALNRLLDAVDRASAARDDLEVDQAVRSLTGAQSDVDRSHQATLRQLQATPPPDAEEESTSGPDSVLATLNVEQVTITELAGLFDQTTSPELVSALNVTLNTALDRRSALLTAVLALDPEEAGAPYADALADTVPAYTDEVANLTEALQDDELTPESRDALQAALEKSRADEDRVTAAFGGGE